MKNTTKTVRKRSVSLRAGGGSGGCGGCWFWRVVGIVGVIGEEVRAKVGGKGLETLEVAVELGDVVNVEVVEFASGPDLIESDVDEAAGVVDIAVWTVESDDRARCDVTH
jgi:hypothetical protein